MDLDLSNLTISQIFALTALIAAIDIVGSTLLAASKGKFDLGLIAVWIQSHVLKRVFPILALAVIGHGIPQLNVPAIDFALPAALAALAAYALETIASIRDSWGGDNTPTDTEPVS